MLFFLIYWRKPNKKLKLVKDTMNFETYFECKYCISARTSIRSTRVLFQICQRWHIAETWLGRLFLNHTRTLISKFFALSFKISNSNKKKKCDFLSLEKNVHICPYILLQCKLYFKVVNEHDRGNFFFF